MIPSQRKTCQLLCKETWDCFKGVCFGSVSPGLEKKKTNPPCSCENKRNYRMIYLGTVHGKCSGIVISAERKRVPRWAGSIPVCVMLGAGLPSSHALLGSCSILPLLTLARMWGVCPRLGPSGRCPERVVIRLLLAPEELDLGNTRRCSRV